jgi:hypothetical protein
MISTVPVLSQWNLFGSQNLGYVCTFPHIQFLFKTTGFYWVIKTGAQRDGIAYLSTDVRLSLIDDYAVLKN